MTNGQTVLQLCITVGTI